VFDLPTGERSVRLVLSRALRGPDPFWLLSHPLG
jgi:serine-type D-Ala-D-Ala carboxypeptidase (penicillin-binding protein 5/6)